MWPEPAGKTAEADAELISSPRKLTEDHVVDERLPGSSWLRLILDKVTSLDYSNITHGNKSSYREENVKMTKATIRKLIGRVGGNSLEEHGRPFHLFTKSKDDFQQSYAAVPQFHGSS